jgi:hypothetical protein
MSIDPIARPKSYPTISGSSPLIPAPGLSKFAGEIGCEFREKKEQHKAKNKSD